MSDMIETVKGVNKMKETTAQRLKKLMSDRGLRQIDIVRKAQPYCDKYHIKMNRSDVSQYVNGLVEPSQWKLTILGLALNVSEAWLMGLPVPMERDDPLPAKNLEPLPAATKKPILGRIACGTPILAEQNIDGYVQIPDWVRADFALVCKGDSMVNARIFDGDLVCIRQQETIESGEIAAVLVDGDEATLKRVRLFTDHIVLEPENPLYRPMIFWDEDMNRVRIIGKATHFISSVK